MIQISGKTPILAKHRKIYQKTSQTTVEIFFINFCPKVKMQNTVYKKLLHSKVSPTRFVYIFYEKLDKVFEVIKNIKVLRFKGDCDKL